MFMIKQYKDNINRVKDKRTYPLLNITVDADDYHPPIMGLILLQVCVGLFFLIFVVRFWYLQIHKGEGYAERAQSNRTRIERIIAPRGLILDKHGTILADNTFSYGISIVREDVVDLSASLAQISAWTGTNYDELLRKYYKDKRKIQAFEPMSLVVDLDIGLVSRIEAELINWPGLEIVAHARRSYPLRDMYAHILGYVAEANERELEKNKALLMGDLIGKQGLEFVLEEELRGKRGVYKREVDVSGRSLDKMLISAPSGGKDISLTIDSNIQKVAWTALEGKTGTIIVMDPDTGQLISLVTTPAYDNNLFTAGISYKAWNALRDNPRHPLQNRAIQSTYPPASIWKLVMTGLLLEKHIKPSETVFCGGETKLGNRIFRCWHAGHGSVDMLKAITQSCDIYYYRMGERLGIDNIEAYAKKCGFGNLTGIILPHEKKGLVPSRKWKKENRNVVWVRGDTFNISIGQGYTLVTPMQIAVYISALLNGGKLLQPQLIKDKEPLVMGEIPAKAKERDFIVNAMRQTALKGTARVVGRSDADMGGKTGTAQVAKLKLDGKRRIKNEELEYKQRDHAWIATFGVKDNVRYVVIVMLEHGGGGSAMAGPVAKKMYEALFGVEVKQNLQKKRSNN